MVSAVGLELCEVEWVELWLHKSVQGILHVHVTPRVVDHPPVLITDAVRPQIYSDHGFLRLTFSRKLNVRAELWLLPEEIL